MTVIVKNVLQIYIQEYKNKNKNKITNLKVSYTLQYNVPNLYDMVKICVT